jgi:ketosteroid isomerase-like protein
MMPALERFGAYFTAFEKAYESDDWAEVGEFFHEDATYEVGLPEPFGGTFDGREAILAYFKRILDGFDRRFASRTVTGLEGPTVEGDVVRIRGRADYTGGGSLPDVGFELVERVTFDGDRIRRLEDQYDDANRATVDEYLAAHGEALSLEG